VTHYNSLTHAADGWKWPLHDFLIEPIRPLVSNIYQTKVYIYRSVSQLPEPLVWKRMSPGILSVGNLLMHLRGTEHQWIGHFLGGKTLNRNKELEMSAAGGSSLDELVAALEQTGSDSLDILRSLTLEDMGKRYTDKEMSAEFILNYTAQHLAYHAGQLVLIRKHFEPDFKLFE
jgi:uncharacterized damage-inducible protein DinB